MGLDLVECPDPVAQFTGRLVIERFARLEHALGQTLLDLAVLAGKKIAHLADHGVVIGLLDSSTAGPGAALDLVLQAGAGARGEHAVGTGAKRKGALQRRQGLVDCACRGEWPKISALALARATMLGDLRPGVIAAQQDVGIGFVVAKKNIEPGLETFDQVTL